MLWINYSYQLYDFLFQMLLEALHCFVPLFWALLDLAQQTSHLFDRFVPKIIFSWAFVSDDVGNKCSDLSLYMIFGLFFLTCGHLLFLLRMLNQNISGLLLNQNPWNFSLSLEREAIRVILDLKLVKTLFGLFQRANFLFSLWLGPFFQIVYTLLQWELEVELYVPYWSVLDDLPHLFPLRFQQQIIFEN